MKLGDHIYTRIDLRPLGQTIYHHGIYCGYDRVIHYQAPFGLYGTVVETYLSDFVKDYSFRVYVENHQNCSVYPPNEVVARAKSRLGEQRYSAYFNNCEHFALWCKTGEHSSPQVKHTKQVVKAVLYASTTPSQAASELINKVFKRMKR
ncbi:lecithin retinol acyltransferase family protein [Cyanobacteria bacterium FACHB-471]|nr:lecithin retinol acyltransferase family protein [Cyanobacteria bacterium FACHB-471]